MDKITWFVVQYASKTANEDGKVLWNTESDSREQAVALAEKLQLAHPGFDFDVSDLENLNAVCERDIEPMLDDSDKTLH